MLGSFESTFQPHLDVDVAETTEHIQRWSEDLAMLYGAGVRRLRYPIRWHRVEREPGVHDWRETDAILGRMQELGMRPVVDLVHHTSYPRWLERGFAEPGFRDAYMRYVEAFAERYPWVPDYTLFNEPFSTLFLCSHEGLWPPYTKGLQSFIAMVRNVLPAVAEASRMYRDLLPDGRHVWIDACERHTSAGPAGDVFVEVANDRRFFVIDTFLGHALDARRPFLERVVRAGGEDLFDIEPGHIDVLGLDYYAHCQWSFHSEHRGSVPTPSPPPLHELIEEYADRYGRPCMLSETNIRGYASDRASWLRYTLEQCEIAQTRGVEIDGYCWFPSIDSCDWDSLLYRCEGNVDPVGVWWLDEHLDRRESVMSRAFKQVVRGASAAELPAYRFRPPVSTWLEGYLPHMRHWDWIDPPEEPDSCEEDPSLRMELRIVEAADAG